MKIPLMLISKESVMLYFAYCRAFKHLGKGFKELFSCIIVTIVFIPLFII